MGSEKIIILHGWAYDTAKWQALSRYLKFTLLKIPGLTAPLSKPWVLDDYVRWLKSVVREPIALIGHSNGGRIALAFAARYPKLVKKLFLIDSAGIKHRNFLASVSAKFAHPFKRFNFLRKLFYWLINESDYLRASPIMQQTMSNLLKSDLTTLLYSIVVPTVIIWGEKDKVTPVSDAYLIHQRLKNSKLHLIKNARHSPQFTHPKTVAKIIHEYL